MLQPIGSSQCETSEDGSQAQQAYSKDDQRLLKGGEKSGLLQDIDDGTPVEISICSSD
jgi:hypothetical protein